MGDPLNTWARVNHALALAGQLGELIEKLSYVAAESQNQNEYTELRAVCERTINAFYAEREILHLNIRTAISNKFYARLNDTGSTDKLRALWDAVSDELPF